jgi:transcriptional regulator with XRE-family HTH domain
MTKKRYETSGSIGATAGHRDVSKVTARQVTEIDVIVGRRIRFRRLTLDLSSEEVAEKIGVAHQQLLKYESAQNRISASRLHSLATVLDVPVHWFFSEPAGGTAVSAEPVPAQDNQSQANGDELAELIRLYTGITDADMRKHFLQGMRLLHRVSGHR